MKTPPYVYGLMAEFESPEALVQAAERAYEAGYRSMDAYSPFPVHGLAEALGMRGTRLSLLVLLGGIVGAAGGFLMQLYAMAIDYPLDVGGRPLNSWPAFMPVTFEMGILFAAFAAVLGMIGLNQLPEPYHPVFNVERFEHASRDSFFLAIEAADGQFDLEKTRDFLESLEPREVAIIEK